MKYVVRGFLFLVIGAVLVGGLVWAFRPQPVLVEVVPVTRGPLRVTVDEDGKTRIKHRYVVTAPVAGRLRRIDLDPGDAVQAAATVVATLEPIPPEMLDARSLAQAQARVQAAEAALARAEPVLERARVECEHAEKELTRIRRLAETKAASVEELERSETLHRAREQDLHAAKFTQDIARFELDVAKTAVLHFQPSAEAPHERRPWKLHAPVTGRVFRVFEESERVVPAGTRLVEVGDPADLEVEVDVLSTDGVKIRAGAKAELEHWGGEQPLHATVRLVEPSAFMKVSALGVEEQRVNVILDLDEPPERRPTLGDGFRVEARIVTWESPDVLQAPTGALFRQGDDWAVFALADGKAAFKKVQLGHRNSLAAEIVAGLEEADRLILHPGDRVRDGIPVQPRDQSAGR